MTIEAAAATKTALIQAQIRTQIATHLLRVARDVGNPQRMLDLVEQAAASTAEIAQATTTSSASHLDAYA